MAALDGARTRLVNRHGVAEFSIAPYCIVPYII